MLDITQHTVHSLWFVLSRPLLARLPCPIFLDAMTVKRNATGDLIFSPLRQKLPVVAMCSLGQRPWDPLYGNSRKNKKVAYFYWHMNDCSGLSSLLCVFMSHFMICMGSSGMAVNAWWFCNLYSPQSVRLCCIPLLWQFLFSLPLLPVGAVIYGQRLTPFAEASNCCTNRSIKTENGDQDTGNK